MKKFFLDSIRSFLATFLALAAVLLVAGITAAWTGPTGNPPTNNIDYPIHRGIEAQTKTGSFSSSDFIAANEFCIPGSTPECVQDWSANAGISCNWSGWKGAISFNIADGSKYPDLYWTTILNCQNGTVAEIRYLLCPDANLPPYSAGVDCNS